MLIRERYLAKIRPYYNVDLIKVLTGVRRCGKSVLLKQIKDEILLQGISEDNIIEINFEQVKYETLNTYDKLLHYIATKITNNEKKYIFLDEIQHVKSFEKALSSLRVDYNCSIFVTGSNSKILSGKLATLLVGRCIEFKIFPFSFKEAYDYLSQSKNINSETFIYDYIKWGGFPLRFSLDNSESIRDYITQTYNGILTKDIINSKSRINEYNFKLISSYIISNSGNDFSANNISKYFLNQNSEVVDKKIIYRYLDKMEQACLISRVKKYDIKEKKQMQFFEKQYAIDSSLITINSNFVDISKGFVLENIVYNELVSRGYNVYVGKTKNSEVDFIITTDDGRKCYIQVAYLLASPEAIKREFGAYNEINDNFPKYVFSLDRFDFSQNGIIHFNVIDFLLDKTKIFI